VLAFVATAGADARLSILSAGRRTPSDRIANSTLIRRGVAGRTTEAATES
jgi:hypothetical protein